MAVNMTETQLKRLFIKADTNQITPTLVPERSQNKPDLDCVKRQYYLPAELVIRQTVNSRDNSRWINVFQCARNLCI